MESLSGDMRKLSYTKLIEKLMKKGPEVAQKASKSGVLDLPVGTVVKKPGRHPQFAMPRSVYGAGAVSEAERAGGREVAEGLKRVQLARTQEQLLRQTPVAGINPWEMSTYHAGKAVKASKEVPFHAGATVVQPKGTVMVKRSAFERGFVEELGKIAAFTRPSFINMASGSKPYRSIVRDLTRSYLEVAEDLARIDRQKNREKKFFDKLRGLGRYESIIDEYEPKIMRPLADMAESALEHRKALDEVMSTLPKLKAR